MSYILDALNRVQRREQQRKAPKARAAEPAFESPAWHVKMVSPVRYTRCRLEPGENDPSKNTEAKCVTGGADCSTGAANVPADDPGLKVPGLPKGAWIAATILTLLVLIECAVVYDVRARMSAIATDVSKLARQISSTEIQTAKSDRNRLNLQVENDKLRQELELVSADLTRARKELQTVKVRQQRVTARKRQSAVTKQKRPAPLPPAAGPLPLGSGFPLGAQNPSRFDTVEAASVKAYSIP